MNQIDRKKLSSELLTNLDVTSCVYLLVKRAAKYVYDTATKKNQTCAYPVGTLAINRQQVNMITTRYWMDYHPDDIVVVGGIAMALYDKVIQQSMSAYGIQSSPYVNNTADIDMVWYPRIMDTEPDRVYEVLTIRSPAMEEHVIRLEEAMKRVVQEKSIDLDNIVYIIKNTIPYIESVQLTVEQSNAGLLAGTYKILIFCTLTYMDHTMIMFELCDLSIHDGCSSQITRKDDGNLILAPMYYDPMYCSPFYQLITIYTPLYVGISVPNILSMIKQQLFAFQNLLHKSSDKCIIYYRRIQYLQIIIALRNRHSTQPYGMENIEMLQRMIDDKIKTIIREHSHGELGRILEVEQNRPCWQYVSDTPSLVEPFVNQLVESNTKKYTIPSTIIYRIKRNNFATIHLNEELKASIEQMEIGKYYSILSTITYGSKEYKRANEQLNRLKRIIHDIHDSMYDKVEKQIIAESKLEPLASILQKERV
jgi:hypothetical protein